MTWQEAVQNPVGFCYRALPDGSTLIRGIDGETHFYANVCSRNIDKPPQEVFDELVDDWEPCYGGERLSNVATRINEITELIASDEGLLESVLDNLHSEIIKLKEQLC